jgi:hypothetical protein
MAGGGFPHVVSSDAAAFMPSDAAGVGCRKGFVDVYVVAADGMVKHFDTVFEHGIPLTR